MSFLGAIKNSFFNTLRDNTLSPAERKNRANASTLCSLTKIAAVSAIVTSIALSILSIFLLPAIWMSVAIISLTLVTILSYDLFVLAQRTQMILDNAIEESKYLHLRNSYDKINYLSRNTLLLGPILQITYRNKV